MRCSSCGRFSLLADGYAARLENRHEVIVPHEFRTLVSTTYVPEPIAADYVEAVRCLQAGLNKAAAAMARRAVQSTCIHLLAGLNPEGGMPERLYPQIDALRDAGEFTNRLHRLAHQVRIFGNNGAHPGEDGLDTVTPEEAEQTVDFLEHLLQHVFILAEDRQQDASP